MKQNINQNYEIINLTSLGIKIQKIGNKFGKELEKEIGINFMNGGCYLFAKVFKEIYLKKGIKTEYIAIGRDKIIENGKEVSEVLDHIVLKVKEEFYIDADGLATKEDLINKIIHCDGIINPKIKENLKEEEIETKINSLTTTETYYKLKKEIQNLLIKKNQKITLKR